jgi:aerobic carbon-monoxide dehydrogenase large subunit
MDDLPPPPPDDGGGGSEGAPVPMGGPWSEPLRAIDRVRYVGEPVAIVLTEDSYQGVDAAEQVIVDYHPLPVVLGPGAADAETLLFPRASSNVAVTAGVPADESAFGGCDVVVRRPGLPGRVHQLRPDPAGLPTG